MGNRLCGVLLDSMGTCLHDEHGCLLPDGHDGPHECDTQLGRYRWETDFDCMCDWCRRNEGDYCFTYWPASEDNTP